MSGALQMIMGAFPVASGGSNNIGFRSGANGTLIAGTITITKPAGLVSGDVMYALFLQDTGTGTSLAGWTSLGTLNTPTNNFPVTLLRRVANGTEGANFAFVPNGASIGEGFVTAFSGANATTPEDATTTTATGTAATITYPTIVSAHANSWHLAFCGNFNALAGTPSGYTARTSGASWTTSASKLIPSASTSVSGVTSTGGGEWVAFSVLLATS